MIQRGRGGGKFSDNFVTFFGHSKKKIRIFLSLLKKKTKAITLWWRRRNAQFRFLRTRGRKKWIQSSGTLTIFPVQNGKYGNNNNSNSNACVCECIVVFCWNFPKSDTLAWISSCVWEFWNHRVVQIGIYVFSFHLLLLYIHLHITLLLLFLRSWLARAVCVSFNLNPIKKIIIRAAPVPTYKLFPLPIHPSFFFNTLLLFLSFLKDIFLTQLNVESIFEIPSPHSLESFRKKKVLFHLVVFFSI